LTLPPFVTDLLREAREDSLQEWLGIEREYTAVDGLAAVGKKVRWAQSQMNNPRHEAQARIVLRKKAQIKELIELGAANSSAIDPMLQKPSPDADIALRAYWEGLQLAGDLHSEERWHKIRHHAKEIGVDESHLESLLGDPQRVQELADAISEIRQDARISPRDLERALAEAHDAKDALGRLKGLKRHTPGPNNTHKRELLDTLRGLLLQQIVSPSSQESLVRTATRRGLSPVRSRSLIQSSLNAWKVFRSKQASPHRVIGVAGTANTERARRTYRKLREGLLLQPLTWEHMEHIARADAAWAAIANQRSIH
jgi:hypothetical protein